MEETAQASERRGSILLVDDEARLRSLLKEFLELNQFEVTTAGSGEEALAQLARAAPEAVLLDIVMPGMDGLSTLKHIRISHPNLPVILISHLDEDDKRQEAVILGANDYLLKPVNFEHLKTLLLLKLFA